MHLPFDGLLDRVWSHMVDLWPEWSVCLSVLGTLSGVMSDLPKTETGIVALAFFSHRVGYDILDLHRGLVDILLVRA